MLHKSLYSEEDTRTECCSTVYCKCLNTRIDFINQSLHRDSTEYEYEALETSLDSQSGVNCTLFFRAFLLSINIKFKWLIGCTIIYNNDNPNQLPTYLYKCHCCSYDLFVSTNNILGKSLINYELHNFNKDTILKKPQYSSSFNILLEDTDTANRNHYNLNTDLPVSHPLTKLVEDLRETEENAMKQRIEDFEQKERRKFASFCDNLEKEYNILTEYATERQYIFNKYIENIMDHQHIINNDDIDINGDDIILFDFKMNSLMKIQKDFNNLMEENLKLDNDEVYNYLNLTSIPNKNTSIKKMHISSGSSLLSQSQSPHNIDIDWLQLTDDHNIKIKLPLNEMGEIGFTSNSNNSTNTNLSSNSIRISPRKHQLSQPTSPMIDDDDNLTDPPSQIRSIHDQSPSGTMVEHDGIRNVEEIDIGRTDDLYDNVVIDDEDENMGFDAISEEDDNEDLMFAMDDDEDEDDDDDDDNDKFPENDDHSLTQTPGSSAYPGDSQTSIPLKMIPELNINNQHSQETQQTIETGSRSFNIDDVDIIQEDSETDDRIFGFDSPAHDNKPSAFTRSRGVASHSKNDSLRPVYTTNYILSPLTSTNFKIKSSKSLQIKPSYQSKSLLSKTLNKNSALVNLNNRNQFDSNTPISKYHPNVTPSPPSNDHQTINPKTFNPPKQWLDVLKQEENTKNKLYSKYSNNLSSKSRQIIQNKSEIETQQNNNNNNGTLTVNNHTFKGIWAKTLPKKPIFPDFDDDDYYIDDDEKKYDENVDDDEQEENKNINKNKHSKHKQIINHKNTVPVHSLFENKQNQQINNMYAYSMGPKYAANQMEHDQQ